MMTLGGSPMAVAVPPMLENTTSAISTGRGSRFNTWHNLQRFIYTYDIKYVTLATHCSHTHSFKTLYINSQMLFAYRIAENFCQLVKKIRFSHRKLSRIARFCHTKGCHAPKFRRENFRESPQNREIRENFLPQVFPLYGSRKQMGINMTIAHTTKWEAAMWLSN